MKRAAHSLIAFLAALGVTLPAHATKRMPQEMQQDLGLNYEIQCSLCHVAGNTGSGTARTPFAISARAYGMDGSSRTLLQQALAGMESDHVDSDGDGVPDITELRNGTDPNVHGPQVIAGRTDPSYGCASGPAGAGALLGLLALAAFARALGRARERAG
jgi:hypothetical protein